MQTLPVDSSCPANFPVFNHCKNSKFLKKEYGDDDMKYTLPDQKLQSGFVIDYSRANNVYDCLCSYNLEYFFDLLHYVRNVF